MVFYQLRFNNIKNVISRNNIIESFVSNFSFINITLIKLNITYKENSYDKLNIDITISSDSNVRLNNGILAIESFVRLWGKSVILETKDKLIIKHIEM